MPTVVRNPKCLFGRISMERSLPLISSFVVIAVFGLVLALPSPPRSNSTGEASLYAPHAAVEKQAFLAKQKSDKANILCLSPDCIHAASDVLRNMNTDVPPCDDFYEFVCGGFHKEHTLLDDQTAVTTFSLNADLLRMQLWELITTERPPNVPKHLKLPNLIYNMCMNESLVEELDTTPIANIAKSLGGWPVIEGDSWNANRSWNWQEMVKQFRHFGFSTDYIIKTFTKEDVKNKTRHIIHFDQSDLGLNREHLVKGFNHELVKPYYDYMIDVAVLFGADRERATIELHESLEFEIVLAKISWPAHKRRNLNDLYHIRTIKQLQNDYPTINWVNYTNALLPDYIQINEDEPVNLSVPTFFRNLEQVLKLTSDRVIANYLMWRIHQFSVKFLSERFRKRQLQYDTIKSGRKKQESRWKECVDVTNERLGIVVGALYVRKHFIKDSRSVALEMVSHIRNTFNETLSNLDWMDETTKMEAKRKLYSMDTYIGYPDELLDDVVLEQYYHNLDIESSLYFDSYLSISVFTADHLFKKLRLPVNKNDWVRHSTAAVVNAAYWETENSLEFPAGILQGHFFNPNLPKYMNYGAIGAVIAHEIMHGFDDQGRRFDSQGKLADWWGKKTQIAFLNRTNCIIKQYANYTEPNSCLKLNGFNTQGENIADNGGVKESYKAYRKLLELSGAEALLPGLNYTEKQMFWISTGQTWCAKIRKEALSQGIRVGVHTPPQFRLIGILHNMRGFAHDFNCRPNSPMNPDNKCEVW